MPPAPPLHLNPVTPVGSGSVPHTFSIKCPVNRLSLLVDTGANVSVLPVARCRADRPRPDCSRLVAANGTEVKTFGSKTLTVSLPGCPSELEWSFVVADVRQALLGADFLRHHRLLVDMAGRKLRSAEDRVASLEAPKPSHPALAPLLKKFSSVFAEDLAGLPSALPATDQLDVRHHIVTTGPPVAARPHRLNQEKAKAVNAELQEMLRLGVVRPSSSPWAAPVHVVRKADGSWRPCGDYRRLNRVTVKDSYPLPNVFEFVSKLAGSRLFSRLDLTKGFWQVPMRPQDIPKTALLFPGGLFEFTRMPFGLKNAPNSFQRLMDEVTRGVEGVFAYLDDILVFAADPDQHLKRLRRLLERLHQYGLKLHPQKCEFLQPELQYLGYWVTPNGVRPPSDKVEAILQIPRPTDGKALRKFLGVLNYYKRFMPNLSKRISALYALTASNAPIKWNKSLTAQFTAAKEALASSCVLSYPISGAPTAVCTDASQGGMGAVLEQHTKEGWRPLAFFSKKFSDAERRASTFERELAAAYFAVRHFRPFIEGRTCAVVTDHKPLQGALDRTADPLTDKQRRWLAFLAETVSGIFPVAGKENLVADLLSRSTDVASITSHGLDLEELEDAQVQDPEVQYLRKSPRFSLLIIDQYQIVGEEGNPPKLFIPASLRKKTLASVHNVAHPGAKQTRRAVAAFATWPGLSTDVAEFVRACHQCQTSRVQFHNHAPLEAFPLPNARFQHVHLDHVGPLPPSASGNRYLLTIVDRYTRYLGAVPMAGPTADATIQAFLLHWVSHFGVPASLTTDRGAAFTSSQWSQFCNQLGIRPIWTTAYHPQSNGLVERANRSLKTALTAKAGDWETALPYVLLSLRTAVKEDLGYSSAELVFGGTPSVPAGLRMEPEEVASPQDLGEAFRSVTFPRPEAPRWHQDGKASTRPQLDLRHCTHVYVRREGPLRPLSPKYEGPYRVLRRLGKAYELQLSNRVTTVSVDRLKPAHVWKADRHLDARADGPPVGLGAPGALSGVPEEREVTPDESQESVEEPVPEPGAFVEIETS